MSELKIYADGGQVSNGAPESILTDGTEIRATLADIGILFERWQADAELPEGADTEMVQAAYATQIAALNERFGFKSIDVVSMHPAHPDKTQFRGKFLDEHTHSDFEVRFFVAGAGLFYLRLNDKVYGVLCTAGDLISVPPGTTHWFDMGANPSFTAVRFFTTADGWLGNFTGSDIAKNYPLLDN